MVVLPSAHHMIPCKWPVIWCSDVLSPRYPTFWPLGSIQDGLLGFTTFGSTTTNFIPRILLGLGGCEVVAPLDASPSTPL